MKIINFIPEIISFLLTLAAAFFGAWFAFLLQNRREKSNIKEKNISSLYKTQIVLFQHYNMMLNWRNGYLNKTKKEKGEDFLWLHLPALAHITEDKIDFDISQLNFLIKEGYGEIISKVLLQQEKFNHILNTINLRSEIHLNQLQPKMESILNEEPIEIEELLGPKLIGELQNYTVSINTDLPKNIESHKVLLDELYTIGKKLFPKDIILRVAEKI